MIEYQALTNRGAIMTFTSLSVAQRTSSWNGSEVNDIRAIVAKYLGINIKSVTDEAHFRDDLHVDWLDRLELLIMIEDHFADLEFSDGDFDLIETVGDLIRYTKDARVGSMKGH